MIMPDLTAIISVIIVVSFAVGIYSLSQGERHFKKVDNEDAVEASGCLVHTAQHLKRLPLA